MIFSVWFRQRSACTELIGQHTRRQPESDEGIRKSTVRFAHRHNPTPYGPESWHNKDWRIYGLTVRHLSSHMHLIWVMFRKVQACSAYENGIWVWKHSTELEKQVIQSSDFTPKPLGMLIVDIPHCEGMHFIWHRNCIHTGYPSTRNDSISQVFAGGIFRKICV